MNYHFFIDEKFVNDFITDANIIQCNQKYIVISDETPVLATNELILHMTDGSTDLMDLFSNINESDKIFIHWYNNTISSYLQYVHPNVKIYLMFMGGDLLQSNYPQPQNISLDFSLFDRISKKEVKKIYKRNLNDKCHKSLIQARVSKNWKNLIHTYLKNILFRIKYKNGLLFKEEYVKRRLFLLRITAVCHWNQYDVNYLEKFYKVKLKRLFFIYGLGLQTIKYEQSSLDNSNEKIKIWLGNSDTVTNNHLDALESLSKFRNENIEIICPLNYGNNFYGDTVEKFGKEWFGDKFVPIRRFIPREKYYELMNQTSIVIMYHNRGQAGGNILAFLLKRKKIFLKSQSSIYKLLKSMGVDVYDANQISTLSFEEFKHQLNSKSLENNSNIIEETLNNETRRIESLKIILNN